MRVNHFNMLSFEVRVNIYIQRKGKTIVRKNSKILGMHEQWIYFNAIFVQYTSPTCMYTKSRNTEQWFMVLHYHLVLGRYGESWIRLSHSQWLPEDRACCPRRFPYSLPPQTQFSKLPTALQQNTRWRFSSPPCMDAPCPALFLSSDHCVPASNSDGNLLCNHSLPLPEDKKPTDLPISLYHTRINSQGLP